MADRARATRPRVALWLLTLALPGLWFGGPAFAADEATGATPDAKDKTVCRKVAETGSILSKRICLSKEEWAAIRKKHDEDDQRARNTKLDPAISMGGGGTPYDISGGAGAFH
jgi:hypothetical protein